MMLDKQIRSLIEYDVKHIKMNNGFFFFLPTSFLAVEKWYGQRMKLGSQVIWYHKRIAALYDSYALFDTMTDSRAGQGGTAKRWDPSWRCASVLVRERANGRRRRVTLTRMKGKRQIRRIAYKPHSTFYGGVTEAVRAGDSAGHVRYTRSNDRKGNVKC